MLGITKGPVLTILVLVTSSSPFIIWLLTRYVNRFSRRKARYREIPRAWKQLGSITSLTMYPLKSAYPMSLGEAFCDHKGLRMIAPGVQLSDRCFMLFKRAERKYVSNALYDHLIRVKVEVLNDSEIQFSIHNDPSVPPFILNMAGLNKAAPRSVYSIQMYERDRVNTLDCGDEASQWFSQYLIDKVDHNMRLGYNCDEQRRLNGTIYERYRHFYGGHITNEDMGKFSYLASYMVMNEKSLEDLNERVKERGESPVSIHNFRGNFILRTNTAYVEDTWTWLRVGDVILRVMKPCTRCKMTCLDPETGRRHPKLEPLQTLRGYRMPATEEERRLESNSPRLGVYCGLYKRGVVRVGDPVYVAADEVRVD